MIVTAPDMTTLLHGVCRRFIYGTPDTFDCRTSQTCSIYDNFLRTESMAFDFDAGRDLWMTEKRFPKLMRDYLDWDNVEGFLDRSYEIAKPKGHSKRGVITQMLTRSTGDQHAWGNCMLAFTFHGGSKNPPTIGLHSRVCYIGFLGAYDMALAWVLGKAIADRAGHTIEETRFRWHVDSLQWHGLKMLPYMIAHGHRAALEDPEEYPRSSYPVLGSARNPWEHMNRERPVDEIKFGPARRLTKRWQAIEGGTPMPSVPLSKFYDQFQKEYERNV